MELKGFTKLNESTAQELLKDDELTIFENMVLDEEIGKPKKRFGWQIYNDNATAGTISSLHEVVTSDGSNYLLTGHSGKLQKSLAGTDTWSDVTDKGTPPYKMQPYADNFIFTDGNVTPFIVNGAALGTVTDLEIEPPVITSIITGSASGGELTVDSKYRWVIVYVTATGDKSTPSLPIAHHEVNDIRSTTTSTATIIGFQNLPVSSDPRVTHRYIYRTMANGDIYYFHSEIDNTRTDWYDEKADSYLGTEAPDFLNIPKTAKYIGLHKERIILGNLTRTVKNWIAPAYSNSPTGADFDINYDGIVKTFSKSGAGIKQFYANDVSGTLSGDYTYRYVFYDTDGLMSDYVDSNTVTVDGTTNQTVVFYVVPMVSESYKTITRCDVYRAKNSTADADFKWVITYNPKRDGTWATLYDSGRPEGVSFVTNQTVDTEKCGVAFSEIGQPATFVLEDVRNIYPDDGDEITGVFDDQDGILIFKLKSICKIFTNGAPDNWRLVKVMPNIGCDQPNSLVKYGNTYAFSSQNSIYTWNSGSGLSEIGVEIWDSLAQVTAFHCATADSGWYMFGVSGGNLTTGYGFLIYDYNMKSWYKFTTTTIPYVAKIKENGDDVGTILTSNATYILEYSEESTDSDTGSTVQITPKLRTKTFGEAIALQRLRKIKFNYLKLSGQNVVITITNPDTSVTNTYTDSTGSGWKLYESPVKDTDSLKETSKFYINITGAGLVEFGLLRVETYPVLRGLRDVR